MLHMYCIWSHTATVTALLGQGLILFIQFFFGMSSLLYRPVLLPSVGWYGTT